MAWLIELGSISRDLTDKANLKDKSDLFCHGKWYEAERQKYCFLIVKIKLLKNINSQKFILKEVKNGESVGSASFQSKERISSQDEAEDIEEAESHEKQSVEEQPPKEISEDFKTIPGPGLEELDEEESQVETAEEVSKEITVAFEKDSAEEMEELEEKTQAEDITSRDYEEDDMEAFEEEESVAEFAPSETTLYKKKMRSEIFDLEEEEDEEERDDEEIEKEDEDEALEEHLEDLLEELMEEEEEGKAEEVEDGEDEEETEEREESIVEEESTQL